VSADLVGNCSLTSAAETAAGIVEINSLLHAELPATHILNLAVLPKGEVWPNRCSDAILAVNAELKVRSLFCHSLFFTFLSGACHCRNVGAWSVCLADMSQALAMCAFSLP
jgi:hypothetical protein